MSRALGALSRQIAKALQEEGGAGPARIVE
jgi:hypothetical protein